MYLFFYDVIGVCLIFIFYEFYLFIFFYIDRLLKLRFFKRGLFVEHSILNLSELTRLVVHSQLTLNVESLG